jgi:DnaJ-class molecular chaperone
MADDPYSVLGVPRTASDEDVTKAFRKLAKESHPDLHPGDKQAAERFKRISGAYDILGDPEKRKKFDRGEIDAAGEARRAYQAHGAQGPFGARAAWGAGGPDDLGIGDIFDLFGGRAGRAGPGAGAGPGGNARAGFSAKGQDVRYTLEVDFQEAIAGAKKRVTLPEGGMLDLVVPEGVGDGQVLRLKGKGSPGFRGGEAGDALVEIKVRPHAQFKRVGDDVTVEVPISIDEAVLGAKIEVPTVTGRVQLTVPKGTSSGTVFRLRGKGARSTTTGVSGDQLVSVKIMLPDTIDEQLSYFMSEWRQKHAYDPRKK